MEIKELFWRVALALLLGSIVGLERNRRVKEAGIRTHGIVSAGACVFMLVSQFAIIDLGGKYDATRIASTIVTGVGFLGVGIIYNRSGHMQGLTTAAGVWATAAIGMCCGAGNRDFVYLAIFVTAIIVVYQYLFHKPLKFLSHKTEKNVKIKFVKGEGLSIDNLKEMGRIRTCTYKREGEQIICSCTVSLFNLDATADVARSIIHDYPSVISVDYLGPLS